MILDWLEATPVGDTLTVFEIIITIGSLWSGGALGGKAVATQRLRTEHRNHIRVEVLPHIPFVDIKDSDRFIMSVNDWLAAIKGARARIGTLPRIDRIAWDNIEATIPSDLAETLQAAADNEILSQRTGHYHGRYATYQHAHLDNIRAEVAVVDNYLIRRLRIGPLSTLTAPRYAAQIARVHGCTTPIAATISATAPEGFSLGIDGGAHSVSPSHVP